MKKMITLGLTEVLVLSAGATTAFASTSIKGTNYGDTDGRGICDNTGLNIGIGRGL